MKKRLLSAVLALAMALTMLPLSVFASPADVPSAGHPVNAKSKVQYIARVGNNMDGVTLQNTPGWFHVYTEKVDNKTVTKYEVINSGVMGGTGTSGTWYTDVAAAQAANQTSFTLLADATSVALAKNGTIDLNGCDLTIASIADAVTSLTLTDKNNTTGSIRSTVSGISKISTATTGFTLNATGVDVGDVTLTNPSTHSITLNNCEAGSITMSGKTDGTSAQTLTINEDRTGGVTSIDGTISVTGNSSRVTLTDTQGSATVNLTGTGTQLIVNGLSNVGDVTLVGSTDTTKKTAAAPRVTVNGGTVGDISVGNTDVLTSKYTIQVNNRMTSVGDISVNFADVTVTQGTAGDIAVAESGTVKVAGDYAKVGDVSFAKGVGSSFAVTGGYNQVGDITVTSGADFKLDIPADPTNTFGTLTLTGYKAPTNGASGVKGGTFSAAVNADYLVKSGAGALTYQLEVGSAPSSTVTYYTQSQLADALNAQGTTSGTLTITGQTAPINGQITFKNGDKTWGVLTCNGPVAFALPGKVNGVDVNNWTDGVYTYTVGQTYTSPTDLSAGKNVTLNAQVTSTDVTKITDVTATNTVVNNVRTSLNGNVITLTGAVTPVAGFAPIDLKLTTDYIQTTGLPLVLDVQVLYNSANKTVVFANPGSSSQLGYGVTLEDGLNTLRLSNGTKYTLNGTGLKELAPLLNTDTDSKEIQATVNISGWTQAQKNELEGKLEGDSAAKTNPGQTAAFTWANSPAVAQAINAAQAGISDSQINTWKTAIQRKAWSARSSVSPTAANLAETGYDQVWMVPYLNVVVTAYNPNGSMTATLVPSYYIEVRQSGGANAYTLTKDGDAIAQAGRSLGQLTGTLTTISAVSGLPENAPTVKFNLDAPFTADTYMHQDATYGYKVDTGVYTINHAGSREGFGSVVINTVKPLVEMKNMDWSGGGNGALETNPHYYDTLQAAVDDVKAYGEITVSADYKGSCDINVTGDARTFTVISVGNNTITSNASGVLVTQQDDGHTYLIQLTKSTVGTGNVVISAATVANGNVSLSTTRAAANSTVTITANPASGYSVTRITAKTNTGANVPVSSTGTNNKYTFTVPAGATSVTVTPEFAVAGQASIIVAPVANGSAVTNASGNVAQTNSTVTVTTTPNANYRTLGVSARTNTGASVAVTRSGNNLYYFTVPAGATSVTITPSFDLDTGMPFVDVLSTEFYLPYVQFVYKNGMMNGTEPTVFSGEQAITRGQLVAILWRQQGSPAAATYAGFVDVSASEYYASAITWAKNNKIVNGTSATTFEPDRAINRQEFATILYNFNNYLGKSTANQKNLNGYTDNGYVESWAKTAMQWCVGNGIISGDTPTTLSPYGTATRYQGATMLTRYCQNFLGMK